MANRSTPARSAWGEVLTRKDAPSIGSHSRTSPFAERALCQLERAGRRGEMGAALPCGRHPVHVRWGWVHAFWLCVGRARERLVEAPADDRSWSGAGGHSVSFAPTRGQSKRRVTRVLAPRDRGTSVRSRGRFGVEPAGFSQPARAIRAGCRAEGVGECSSKQWQASNATRTVRCAERRRWTRDAHCRGTVVRVRSRTRPNRS